MDIGRGSSAGKREQRLHAGVDVGHHSDNDGDDNRKGDGVAQGNLCTVAAPLAKPQGRQGVAAVTHEHRKGHEDDGDGKRRRSNGKAQLAYRLAQESGRYDAIGAVDQHARNGGYGKLQEQLGNRCAAHAHCALVAVIGNIFLCVDLILAFYGRYLFF